jgi:pheromone shutdown protein TraB
VVSDRFDAESLSGGDPRLAPRFVRVVDTGGDYPVIVVGVVHDHPASVFRATTVADAVEPDVVALELPDALVGLFESYAAADGSVGGEMAAAIAAAPDADVAGIDAPSVGATRVLAAELVDRDLSVRAVARTLREFGRLGVETVRGRLSVAGVPETWLGDVPGTSQEFDLTDAESPAAVANHEAAHVRRSTSLLRRFEVPAASRVLDAARERYMAARLRALSTDSVVVAVVGFSHLDSLADSLATN